MATLWIREYKTLAETVLAGRIAQAPMEPALAVQKITYGTAAESSAFNDDTRFVLIQPEGAQAMLSFSETSTVDAATANSGPPLADGALTFRGVHPGSKLSVYDGTS